MSLLEVKNLRVEFPTRRGTLLAIDDISFSIEPGEVLGVVGESGAGKSLTGAAIIGLLEPPGRVAAGEIWLEGDRIDNLSYDRMRRIRGKKIGAIFQDPLTSLNPLYTISRQLTETIMVHSDMNLAAARKRAIELLAEVGIPAADKRIDSYPHEFSGGMRQRVVIALAICANPRLIIADEPTTALDVSIQAQIIALLKRLCRDHNTAVMLITHDMGVIAETADRVAVMYAGRIVEIGRVRDVIKHAKHPYSEGLMGSIPVLGHDVERSSHQALLELDVEPVLTVLDATGDLEEDPAEAGALPAQRDLVIGERGAATELGEEADWTGLPRLRREVVDRVANHLRPRHEGSGIRLSDLCVGGQRDRLPVRGLDREVLALQRVLLHTLTHRGPHLEEHPLLSGGLVGQPVPEGDVPLVVVGDPHELTLEREQLRHSRLRGLGLLLRERGATR